MSHGNQFLVKRALRPEWYTHGSVHTFSKEEIEEWSKSCAASEMYTKIDNQRGMPVEEIKFLDELQLIQEEGVLSDLMKGPTEGE